MRTYGTVVEMILVGAGLSPETARPQVYAEARGWRPELLEYAAAAGPPCRFRLLDGRGAVVGDGWGGSIREAALAALADALTPGGEGGESSPSGKA